MRAAVLLVLLHVPALVSLAQHTSYAQDPKWQAPGPAAARANPLPITEAIVGGGRKLFLRHCAECHGRDGSGLRNAADLQLPVVQRQSDGTLSWKITNGNGRRGMPSFSGLPDAQRWQLIRFLRTLAVPSASDSAKP
jgi:mono/diheme cytochrome c family protein